MKMDIYFARAYLLESVFVWFTGNYLKIKKLEKKKKKKYFMKWKKKDFWKKNGILKLKFE